MLSGGRKIKRENWSSKASNKIGEILMLDNEQREVIKYGLSVLTSNLLGLFGVLLIAYILGVFIPTLAISVVLLFLRPNAGGGHCSSSLNCSLFGYVLIPLFGYGAFWISQGSLYFQFIFITGCACWGLTWIILRAPYFTQSKPRAEARDKKLKVRASVLALTAFLISVALLAVARNVWATGIAAGLLFQGLMLSPAGVGALQFLDNFASNIFKKGGEYL